MLRSSCSWLSRNSSVSLTNAVRRLSSNHGYLRLASGVSSQTLRTCSHWLKKFCTSAVRARGSASMRRTCRSNTFASRSFPRIARSSSSSSGMLLHRKNDRRDASSTSGDAIGRARLHAGGIGFDAKQKIGADEQPLERRADAGFEVALGAPGLVEAEQRLHVVVRRRPAIRAPRQRRENLRRARRFLACARRESTRRCGGG